jgi:hypothetical protein
MNAYRIIMLPKLKHDAEMSIQEVIKFHTKNPIEKRSLLQVAYSTLMHQLYVHEGSDREKERHPNSVEDTINSY